MIKRTPKLTKNQSDHSTLYTLLSTLFLSAVLLSTFHVLRVEAADTLSVVNISTKDKPGYTIYWASNKGQATLERSQNGGGFTTLTTTTESFYVDYAVVSGTKYTYRVSYPGNTLTATSSDLITEGKAVISNIKITSGTASKTEASVVVTFKTDILAEDQIFYGQDLSYGQESEINTNLNQSHTILLEKLKPGTVYHVKVRSLDASGKNLTDSDDQTFTTPIAPPDTSLLQIIIAALTQAFSGFAKWLQS